MWNTIVNSTEYKEKFYVQPDLLYLKQEGRATLT